MNLQPKPPDTATSERLHRWGQRVGAFTGLPPLLDKLGVSPGHVLSAAGLPADALDRAENRIPFELFGRLLQHSAEMAGYAHLGLTAGRMWHVDDLGAVGVLARHAATLGEALQFMTVYQHLNSEGGLAFVARHDKVVEVGYAIYYPGVPGADQIYDFALATIFGLVRELAGTAWLPSEVFLPHTRPGEAVHYRNLFRVQPHFDSEVCSLRFPAFWMDRPIDNADPAQRRRALHDVNLGSHPDLLQQVYRALRNLLLSGRSSGDEVAQMLSMHRRTLNRRLRQQGTTFQHVLDNVRCEVARQLLIYSHVPLDDIAASLGYAGVSPFMRSFRRWTGLSPGQLRHATLRIAASNGSAPGGAHDAAVRLPRGRSARRSPARTEVAGVSTIQASAGNGHAAMRQREFVLASLPEGRPCAVDRISFMNSL